MVTLEKNKCQKQNAHVEEANVTTLELDLGDTSTAAWKKYALYRLCS